MAIRLRNVNSVNDPANPTGPEFVEVPFENRVTEHDGIQFHWAPNQVRNFADDGVAAGHAAAVSNDGVVEDITVGDGARS